MPEEEHFVWSLHVNDEGSILAATRAGRAYLLLLVPEVQTHVLMLSGFGVLGLVAHRWKSQCSLE